MSDSSIFAVYLCMISVIGGLSSKYLVFCFPSRYQVLLFGIVSEYVITVGQPLLRLISSGVLKSQRFPSLYMKYYILRRLAAYAEATVGVTKHKRRVWLFLYHGFISLSNYIAPTVSPECFPPGASK